MIIEVILVGTFSQAERKRLRPLLN